MPFAVIFPSDNWSISHAWYVTNYESTLGLKTVPNSQFQLVPVLHDHEPSTKQYKCTISYTLFKFKFCSYYLWKVVCWGLMYQIRYLSCYVIIGHHFCIRDMYAVEDLRCSNRATTSMRASICRCGRSQMRTKLEIEHDLNQWVWRWFIRLTVKERQLRDGWLYLVELSYWLHQKRNLSKPMLNIMPTECSHTWGLLTIFQRWWYIGWWCVKVGRWSVTHSVLWTQPLQQTPCCLLRWKETENLEDSDMEFGDGKVEMEIFACIIALAFILKVPLPQDCLALWH